MHVYIYIYIYVFTYIYIYIGDRYVYMYLYIYICTHTHTSIYIYIFIHTCKCWQEGWPLHRCAYTPAAHGSGSIRGRERRERERERENKRERERIREREREERPQIPTPRVTAWWRQLVTRCKVVTLKSQNVSTVNPRTKHLDFRGFGSSRCFISRGGILKIPQGASQKFRVDDS